MSARPRPASKPGMTRTWGRAVWERRHDPLWRSVALLAALFVAAVFAFAHIAEDYLTGDPIVRWDVHLAAWLHTHSSPSLVSLFEVVTYAGDAVFLAVVTATACLLLVRRRAVNEAGLLVLVAIGIEVVNGGLKLLFHRPRPELAFIHLDTYSFPSGHAASSVAIYGVLAFLFVRRRSWPARAGVVSAAAVLVAVVGFSRIYLGVHYLSDVLAGFSLGAAWLFAWLVLYELCGRRNLLPLLPISLWRLLARIGGREHNAA
jgi:membrane-associated phospholipid phosphatase